MSDRTAFLDRRRSGIGGSDVGAIVGVNPYRNALDVYLEKTGEVAEDEPSDVQLRGRYLEPVVMDLFFERSGRRKKNARFRRHRDHKWMIGHPDALIGGIDGGTEVTDRQGILECKTMAYSVLKRTTEKGLSENYQLQGQHYMALCGHPWMAFALLHPDTFRFATVELEANPDIQKQIVEICEHFWFNHVNARQPPKPVDPEWEIELPAVDGVVEDRTDPEWRQLMEQDQALRAMREEAVALYDANRAAIKEACGRHGVFEGAGARVYFKQRAGRRLAPTMKELEAAGFIDPIKLAAWAVDLEEDYPGITALLQAAAGELNADIGALQRTGKPSEDLRIYHILED